MEVENLKNMGLRLMSAMRGEASGGGGGDIAEMISALQLSADVCRDIYANKPSLATDTDVRVSNLCNQWLRILTHGLKVPSATYQPLQNLITVGLNFAFNLNLLDTALWDYTRLHLTRHEEERFKLLKMINTPKGYFKAFLRAALNEKSLERYLQSWIGHELIIEYYEDWAIVRNSKYSNRLPELASGLASIFFALSIDKPELNESSTNQPSPVAEPVIALNGPVMKSNLQKKPLRQIISFDTAEESQDSDKSSIAKSSENNENIVWNSAPPTCGSSPIYSAAKSTLSELNPASSNGLVDGTLINNQNIPESPREILARLSDRAKDIFSNKTCSTFDTGSHQESDISSTNGESKKYSESDYDDGPVEGLELCFPDEIVEADDPSVEDKNYQEQNILLKLKISQMENDYKDRSSKMEQAICNLTRENARLKEQLRNYVSAVQTLDDTNQNEEVKHYEAKLVQVAQMHAELMEFNEMLQKQLQAQMEPYGQHYPLSSYVGIPDSNVNIWIPSTYLVTSGSKSFHLYQVFIKVCTDEWNVYRRYSEFRNLYGDLKNSHPDIAFFKFPPKKALGKKEPGLVEQRRCQLQGWLRHVVHALPQLYQSSTRRDLITLLPFFGERGNFDSGRTLRPIPTP